MPRHGKGGGSEPNQSGLDQWPILDSRGNTLDEVAKPKVAKTSNEPQRRGDNMAHRTKQSNAEKNKINWREATPETGDEGKESEDDIDDRYSEDDDIDDDDGVMGNKIPTDRNYMYPAHDPTKRDPSKPPIMKFKPSLFSRNVLVVRAMKKLEKMGPIKPRASSREDEDDEEGGIFVIHERSHQISVLHGRFIN